MKRFILTLLLFVFAPPAWGEVIINVETRHYGVVGRTKQDIMRSMQHQSPFKKGNSFVPAYTGTDMRYQYVLKQKGNRCSVKDATVLLNLTYMYPKLAQHQSSEIRWWWRDLIKAYTIHEEIHGDISIRWAHELDRELKSIKDLNCSSANQVIQERAKRIYDKLRDEQETYDKITNHGQQQYKYKGPE